MCRARGYFKKVSATGEEECREDDREESGDGQEVRHLGEAEEAERRREENPRVVEDHDVLRRRIAVGERDAELSDRRPGTGSQQDQHLQSRHRIESRRHERDGREARERAEEEDDEGRRKRMSPQGADACVRPARTDPAQKPDRKRKRRRPRKPRLRDQHDPEERKRQRQELPPVRPLAEEEPREKDREERRRLVEREPLRNRDLPERIEVREDAGGAERRTEQKKDKRP